MKIAGQGFLYIFADSQRKRKREICNLLLVLQSLPPPSHSRDGSACPQSRTSTSGHLSGSTCPASQSPGKPRARRRPPLSSSDAGHTNLLSGRNQRYEILIGGQLIFTSFLFFPRSYSSTC